MDNGNKMVEAVKRGHEAFLRLEAAGFLVLYGENGEKYSMTDRGKARVSSLIGHSCVTTLSRLPHLISAMEAWLFQHQDDDSDDYALVMAVATLMQANGLMRMKFAGWR
jgi:hypothetical protein